MTRQEPQAKRPWRSSAKKPVLLPPALSQPVSSKKAGPSSSKAGSASQPASSSSSASQPASSRVWGEAHSGEQITKIFRKTHKMTSLATTPRRKPRLPRAGAHCSGLWDVEEARTSPLQPPESRRLDAPIRYFLRKVLVFCGKFWYLRKVLVLQCNNKKAETLTLRKVLCQDVGHVFEAFRSSYAAESP